MSKFEPQKMTVGEFSTVLGALVNDRRYTHIASTETKLTACGEPVASFILGYDFLLNCPMCLKEFEYRSENPDACREPMGVCHVK